MKMNEGFYRGDIATVSMCYETDCLLCGNKVVVKVDVAMGGGFIKERVVCDQCKAFWKKIMKGENDERN